jgi:3D (Asp-Asp-Asp) domain-containing protein
MKPNLGAERSGMKSYLRGLLAIHIAFAAVSLLIVPLPASARHRHRHTAAPATAYAIEPRSADSVLHMTATAYTPYCGKGCSGITALGRQAGYGIVAVDPRVIPLRTRLFIPGYGTAIAGDTGRAIKGSRIDLGFNSYTDAMRFGRREIIVYVLH